MKTIDSGLALAMAALLLCACQSPQGVIEAVEALNDGCDKTVDINLAYVAPMPPSGTVRITKDCSADKRRGLSVGDVVAAEPVAR